MPEPIKIISDYLEGAKLLSLTFMDYNEHEKDGSFKTRNLHCMDNIISWSIYGSAIYFQCGKAHIELPLDDDLYIVNKPYEEDITFQESSGHDEEPPSDLETFLMASKSVKKGIAFLYFNRNELSKMKKELNKKN
jgi:hypothetical protein